MTTGYTTTEPALSLVADIGGTFARFGLMEGRAIRDSQVFRCAGFPSVEAAARAYLASPTAVALPAPRQGAFAIAGPVTGDRIAMTNQTWAFSIEAVRQSLGLERLTAINDFTAVAMAVPWLGPADGQAVGPGAPVAGEPVAVLGPGSGLGMSGLVPAGAGWTALAGEGGHATMAAACPQEAAVLDHLYQTFGHVSIERVLSGPGLVNLYQAIAVLAGRDPLMLAPADVSDRAINGQDDDCGAAVDMFCAMLGTAAGNLALTLGARGGVFIAGGIVPRLGWRFTGSAFRARFEAKGRMRDYLAAIPTCVITHPLPAFLGLAHVLAGQTLATGSITP
jgi:glucokinase